MTTLFFELSRRIVRAFQHFCFLKTISLIVFSFAAYKTSGQTHALTISTGGQSGSSGTNWTSSGSGTVTITVTGNANIHPNVITGHLNLGRKVIVNNTAVGTIINANIIKTGGGAASLTFQDIGPIWVESNITISSGSGALDVILWADADNSQGGTVSDYLATGPGVTIASNGGKIVMAGGTDNGANGGISGDGIPDGFAWNGSNGTAYGANTVGGLTLGERGGTGAVVSLLSDGGDMILRGATSGNNIYPGITSQANVRIESGTGQIIMHGKSITGHGIELTYGTAPSIAISSSSTNIPAISITGTTTTSTAGYAGFWASNNMNGNMLIQSTATSGGGVWIDGASANGVGLRLGHSTSNMISQILSQSGEVTIKASGAEGALQLYGDVNIGNRKNNVAIQGITPAITNAASDIRIQADGTYQFSNVTGKSANISSTGALSIESNTPGYTGTLSWVGNVNFLPNFSSITLGRSSGNYTIHINTALGSTGSITAFANNVALGDYGDITSSGSGNITINTKGSFSSGGTRRRTIRTSSGNITINADADANGSGDLNIDYITFNSGTGNTILRTETLTWGTASNTDKPYINGTGSFTLEPSRATFQNVNTSWFAFDQDGNGMAGLTIGKITNTGGITHATTALTIAGPIYLVGGVVTLDANLTSSADGDIFIKANTNSVGSASLNNTASILKTAGTGTLTMQSQARLNSGTITASGSGRLNVILWSDYGNANNGGVAVTPVTTNGGHFWLGGSNTTNGFYTWNGLTVGNGPSVGSVNNNYNAIDFRGPVSTAGGDVLIWAGNGYSNGTSGINVMQSGSYINAGTGNITLIADNIDGNDINISTTGTLSLLPDDNDYPAAITWSGALSGGNFNASAQYDRLNILNFANLGGLTIGYYNQHLSGGVPVVQTNGRNITVGTATTISGSLTFYGAGLIINQHLASTAGGNISLLANTLSLGSSVRLSSSGNLIIQPISTGTTIGLTGGTGTLAVSANNFNTNFNDGFAEIQIGNSNTGNISFNTAITTKDNIRLTTNGNFLLNEILDIGNNDLRFTGNTIIPASNKFVKTNGNGKLIMNIANNAQRLFPLGVDHYNPVTITNRTGFTNEFYATVSPGVFYEGTSGGTGVTWSPRIDLTWNIGNATGSTGAGNIDLSFGWKAENVTGALTTPRLLHHDGTAWEQLSGTPAFNLVAGTLDYTGYTGTFSPFGIAAANLILPVTWVSFSGKQLAQKVVLQWVTASEQNNQYFDIERSADGTTFTSIGMVNAGTQQTERNTYYYTDYAPAKGRSHYRLKQVDHDGRNSYSSIVTIFYEGNTGFKTQTAPGSKQLIITTPDVAGKLEIVIFDAAGRQLMRKQIVSGQRNNIQTGFLSANAIYFLTIVQDGKRVFSDRFVHQ